MSETFDEVVEASWTRYEERLVGWMRAADDGYVQIDSAEGGEEDLTFVTIDWDEDGLAADAAGRVGGKLWFDGVEGAAPSDVEESA